MIWRVKECVAANTVFVVELNIFVVAARDHWNILAMPGKAAGPKEKRAEVGHVEGLAAVPEGH